MGGNDALLSIEESIPLVVDMVEANRGKPGLRYLDRFNKPLPWTEARSSDRKRKLPPCLLRHPHSAIAQARKASGDQGVA
jgi:hypothetical protein